MKENNLKVPTLLSLLIISLLACGKPGQNTRHTEATPVQATASKDSGRHPGPPATNINTPPPIPKNKTMNPQNDKIEKALQEKLAQLPDTAMASCLIYPATSLAELEKLLQRFRQKQTLEFNALPMAGCIAANAPKKALLELAKEDAVGQMKDNPQFKAD